MSEIPQNEVPLETLIAQRYPDAVRFQRSQEVTGLIYDMHVTNKNGQLVAVLPIFWATKKDNPFVVSKEGYIFPCNPGDKPEYPEVGVAEHSEMDKDRLIQVLAYFKDKGDSFTAVLVNPAPSKK